MLGVGDTLVRRLWYAFWVVCVLYEVFIVATSAYFYERVRL